jgi:hypothetical protein
VEPTVGYPNISGPKENGLSRYSTIGSASRATPRTEQIQSADGLITILVVYADGRFHQAWFSTVIAQTFFFSESIKTRSDFRQSSSSKTVPNSVSRPNRRSRPFRRAAECASEPNPHEKARDGGLCLC